MDSPMAKSFGPRLSEANDSPPTILAFENRGPSQSWPFAACIEYPWGYHEQRLQRLSVAEPHFGINQQMGCTQMRVFLEMDENPRCCNIMWTCVVNNHFYKMKLP